MMKGIIMPYLTITDATGRTFSNYIAIEALDGLISAAQQDVRQLERQIAVRGRLPLDGLTGELAQAREYLATLERARDLTLEGWGRAFGSPADA